MTLVLHQKGETPVSMPPVSPETRRPLCLACGAAKRKVRKRKSMPATIAPNPYDQPVTVDPASQALLEQGRKQVAKAKARAKRKAYVEQVATWTPARIQEAMRKIDAVVQSHEDKITEQLRQRAILEDQLALCGSDAEFQACLATIKPEPAKQPAEPEPEPAKPKPKPEPACPF